MAKGKKKANWVLIIAVMFILGGIMALIEKIKESAHPVLFAVLIVVGLVAVAVCVFLILRHAKKKKDAAIDSVDIPDRSVSVPKSTRPAPDQSGENLPFIPQRDKQGYNCLPDIINGWALKYKYDECMFLSDCSVEDLAGKTGETLDIVLEPENEYDPGAVALFLKGKRIGYVHRGRLQDMIHDWIDRDEKIICYLHKLTVRDAYCRIGFYKPLEYFKGRTFKIVKITSRAVDGESRAEHASLLSPGDEVEVYIDGDSYIVSCGASDFGELSKSAISYVEGASRIVGRVESCDFDDNGKPEIYVTIYPIK